MAVTSDPPVPFGAVAAAFASNALLWGSFVPRIPDVADRLAASPGEIAVPMFAYMAGGLVASSGAGVLLGTRSPAWGQTTGLTAGAIGLALGASGTTLWVVTAVLFASGLGDGLQDVSMNSAAVDLESARGRPVMARLHAVWSLAFLSASALGAGAAAIDLGVPLHITLMSGVALVVGVSAALRFSPVTAQPDPDAAAAPVRADRGMLVALGVATAVGSVMEMVPNDWSALYLRDELGAAAGVAALGPAVFMSGMVLGRLFGDRLGARFGPARALSASATLAAVGLAAGLASGQPVPALVGVGVAGLGAAFTYPGLFSLAARQPGVPRERGLAFVSTIGRLGFVVAPIATGAVAEATSLRVALHVPVVAGVIVAVLALRLRTGANRA